MNKREWNSNILLLFLKRSSIFGYLQGRHHAVEWNTSEAQQFLHVHAPHHTHCFNVNVSVMSLLFDAFALSPYHTITECENRWVTDTIYGNPLIIRYSSLHFRFIRYRNVDVRWCPVYPLGSLCMFKIANGQPTDNSPVVVRSLSVPNPFCSVLVLLLSGTRAVHIRSYPVAVRLRTTTMNN